MHTQAHTHTHKHKYTRTHTHTHAHTYTHIHTHTRTHHADTRAAVAEAEAAALAAGEPPAEAVVSTLVSGMLKRAVARIAQSGVAAYVDRGAVVASIQAEAARKRTVHATVCVRVFRTLCVCVCVCV